MERGHKDFFKMVEKPCSDVAKPMCSIMDKECIEFDVFSSIDMDMTVTGH